MLTDAAESRAPDDLAARAITSAKRRRRTRAVVVGSVAAAAALVLGSVVTGTLVRSSDEPQPTDVMSLPQVMPSPEDLPSLADAPMSTAAAAYVNDDKVVLVNSQTQEAATWSGLQVGDPSYPAADSHNGDMPTGGALRPYQVSLSPDGRFAMVALQYSSSTRLLGIPVAVLDIATGETQTFNGLRMLDAYVDSGWLRPNFMAWTPDSSSAYCVCLGPQAGHIAVWAVNATGSTPPFEISPEPAFLAQSQISVGSGGYAMETDVDNGQWLPGAIDQGGGWQVWDTGDGLPRADALAIGIDASQPGAYTFMAVDGDQYSIGELGKHVYPWDVWASLPGGGSVASVHAAPGGFIAVTWPKNAERGTPPPPASLEVWYFDAAGTQVQLSTLPEGTDSASFSVAPLS